MLKFSLWLKIAALCLALVLAGCGGAGSSSLPPAGGIVVTPGNGQVTITWQATAGVDYWLMYAPTASAIDIKNPPANHFWVQSISSPYVLTGLTNGTTYSFAMNGRTSGGAGGAQTASVSATPRYAGSTWIAGNGAAGALRGISYGTSAADSLTYFVAVGDGGAVYKAADSVSKSVSGYSWSPVTSGPAVNFKAAAYAYGRFVAVGNTGGASNITSTADLANWAPATLATGSVSAGLNAVASNGTTLVAVGNSGTILYSSDALTWTAATSTGTLLQLNAVAYSSSNATWVAVGVGGVLVTSTDGGVTWATPSTYTAGGTDLNGVAVTSGNVFVTVGAGGVVLTSNNGSAWSQQTPGPTTTLNAVSTDSVQFVAVGTGGKAFTSPDGVTWTPASNTSTMAELFGVVGSVSKYVAVGQSGSTISSLN